MFAKCGAFFAENGHFDKVVSLFITCTDKNPSKALELCMKRHVQVSKKMAGHLTPSKEEKKGAQAGYLLVLEKLVNFYTKAIINFYAKAKALS
jgi:hypothetical protein